MQKLVTEFKIEGEGAKISKKGIQRLIIIPKDLHHELAKLKDTEYIIEIKIKDPEDSRNTTNLRIIGKVSKMAEQRQIFIPIKLHKDIKTLKNKKYDITISIHEI